MDNPLLSIVIANYNYGRFLEDAIRSVVFQPGFEKCELIVCDAASTDNSVEIIKKYGTNISWWCSEKDKGQSDAFNKGFGHARGKYLTWLNADDLIPEGSLTKIVAALARNPDCEWFTGNFYRFVEGSGKVCEVGWGPHIYPKWMQHKNSPIVVFGPTSFFSRKIYEQVGKIDENFHYAMDTDLWVKFIVAGIKQRRINCFCWAFRMHEGSKTAEFGAHEVGDAAFEKMCAEERLCYQRAGYEVSKVGLLLLRILRLVDGSFIRGKMLRRVPCAGYQ